MPLRIPRSPFTNSLYPAVVWLLSEALLIRVSAAQINATIDDDHSDDGSLAARIDYTGLWQLGTDCHPARCVLQPEPSSLYNGTWHYAHTNPNETEVPSFTLTFTGTAVYVYGVAFYEAGSPQNPFAFVDLSFNLNGQPSGKYQEGPLGGPGEHYEYNRTVYAKTGLSGGIQTLQVTLNPLNRSAFLFDRADYTVDGPAQTTISITADTSQTAPPGPSHPTHPTGLIVGASLGAAALIALVSAVVIYLLRRRKRVRRLAQGTKPDLSPADAGDVSAQGSATATATSPPPQRKHRGGHMYGSASGNSTHISTQGQGSSISQVEGEALEARPTLLTQVRPNMDAQTLPSYEDVRRGL